MRNKKLSIALVAGEHSGDILGANLIREIKKYHPQATFIGVGGALMQQEGLRSVYSMDQLTAIGFTEALKKLPKLLVIRKQLAAYLIQQKPDVFIGIDAPDFNLGLAKRLKQAGIRTIHYVSPTIWAWRKNRIHQIKQATDLVLCLYPFEVAIYQKHQHPALFVGHPLAHSIALDDDQDHNKHSAKAKLGIKGNLKDMPVIALLPGSRPAEINHLGKLFFQVAYFCWQQNKQIQFLLSAANQQSAQQIASISQDPAFQGLPVKIFTGQSQTVLCASDAVLVASGTATLETLLMKRPMTVAYKLNALSYLLLSKLIKIPYVAQPNWLAGKVIVPEFIQKQATVENLAASIMDNLAIVGSQEEQYLTEMYYKIHQQLISANLATALESIFV